MLGDIAEGVERGGLLRSAAVAIEELDHGPYVGLGEPGGGGGQGEGEVAAEGAGILMAFEVGAEELGVLGR